mmetsp:Transcript_12448/g.20240  ORF Transcript_12448/g.20240 Transcript_12448/m.20240 type:complete len:439 (-) Transcript_12448:502-1818(-)
MSDGQIAMWKDDHLENTLHAHTGPVFALASYKGSMMISGGKDGRVNVYMGHTLLKKIDLAAAITGALDEMGRTKVNHGAGVLVVRSLSANPIRRRHTTAKHSASSDDDWSILVATKSSDVFELTESADGVRLLLQGHGPSEKFRREDYGYHGEVWGLATHPIDSSRFATVGDDRSLRVWSMRDRNMVSLRLLTEHPRCVDYSPNGKHIAVGFLSGGFKVFEAEERWREVASRKNRRGETGAVRFSPPPGMFLAVGSADGVIDIYHCRQGYKRIARCKGPKALIERLDWDMDSQYLQVQIAGFESLLYWDAVSGIQMTRTEVMREIPWASRSCTACFPSLGAHRTTASADAHHKAGTLRAIGDTSGRITLLHRPFMQEMAIATDFSAHSSPYVSCIAFTCDNQRIISVGGPDLCICQWRVKILEEDDGTQGEGEGEEDP